MIQQGITNESGEVEKAGCVVVNERQEILLVTNIGREYWGLPKGHLELGETIRQAALREVAEETGYEVELVRPIDDLAYYSRITDRQIRVHYFLAKPVRQLGLETEEQWGWFSLSQAITMVPPNVKDFLEKLFKDQ